MHNNHYRFPFPTYSHNILGKPYLIQLTAYFLIHQFYANYFKNGWCRKSNVQIKHGARKSEVGTPFSAMVEMWHLHAKVLGTALSPYFFLIYGRVPFLGLWCRCIKWGIRFHMFFPPLKVFFLCVWFFVSGTAPFLRPLATVIQCILSISTIHSSNVEFVTDSVKPSSFCSVGWLTFP